MTEEAKREFWDQRACLGRTSGTNDFPLKKLELDIILQKISRSASVLDVGCGNGETLICLAKERACTGTGIDFSPKMCMQAVAASRAAGCEDRLIFQSGRIPGLSKTLGEFDFVLTERSLINLDDEANQKRAFLEIMSHVKPNGRYLMIESFIQGLERTNQLRQMLGLERLEVPWHNVFLDEFSVASWAGTDFVIEEVTPFTSTYHFLSRVVYAKLARDKGEELRYDSDINQLSLRLPVIGNFGPVQLWMWRRLP